MRFLFGLILGAVLTLFVATTFNVPTHALVDKGKTSWDGFLLATGRALFEIPKAPVPTSELVVEDQSAPEGLDISGIVPQTETNTEVGLNVQPSSPEFPEPVASEPRDLDTLLAAEETAVKIADQVPDPGIDFAPPVLDFDTPTQTVWVPFRSQMSAQGFARRLTGKLDHPFSVNREGPGRYQVIFSYDNEYERLAVLDQVQSVTGQEAQ